MPSKLNIALASLLTPDEGDSSKDVEACQLMTDRSVIKKSIKKTQTILTVIHENSKGRNRNRNQRLLVNKVVTSVKNSSFKK